MKTHYLLHTLLFGTALASLPLASCASDDSDAPSDANNANAIRFTALAGSNIVRAETDILPGQQTTSNLDEFQVWAYNPTTAAVYMDGVKVQRASDSSDWTYSPVQYWPAEELSFFALYPVGLSPIYNATAPASTSSPFTFTLTNSGAEDVIYAVAANMQKKAGESAPQVQLNFQHALSQVEVYLSTTTAALSSVKFNVQSVTLKNLYTGATYTLPQSSTGTTGVTSPLAVVSGLTKPTDVSLAQYSKTTTLSAQPLLANTTGTYYFVPQSLADTNVIEISLQAVDATTGAQIWPESGDYATVSYPLKGTEVTALQQGHRYVYNITMTKVQGMQPIEFVVTVDEYNMNNTAETGDSVPS